MGISGAIAGLGSLAGGVMGLVGGSPAQNVQLPQPLPGVGQSGQNFLDTTGGLGQYNLYGQNIPGAQGVTNQLFNNPYASQYQSAAGPAGQMGQLAGLGQFGAGANLYGGGNAIMNTAFDPQSSLYNYLQNQNTQQSNAENVMAGVGSTPYGAGVTDMSNMLFNLNWQNQQLGRQAQGLGAAGQAYGQGAALQGQAPSTYLQGAALPYGTFNTIGQGQLGALSNLGQFGQSAAQIPQNQASLYSGYATGGQGANNQLGQLGLNQANLGFNQNQQYGANIGWGLGQLSNYGGGYSPYQMSAYNPSTMGPLLPGGFVNP